MAAKTFQCSVITPEKQVFDGQVDSVVVPAHDGEIGILLNRAPLVCKLGVGAMRIKKDDQEQTWFIDAGFAQVVENRVIVLTQQALRPEQIDRRQAEELLKEARFMKVTDDISLATKTHAESVARVQLRMSR